MEFFKNKEDPFTELFFSTGTFLFQNIKKFNGEYQKDDKNIQIEFKNNSIRQLSTNPILLSKISKYQLCIEGFTTDKTDVSIYLFEYYNNILEKLNYMIKKGTY